ncbi:hypothetical protein C0992_005913 [Termitomyces sp. T32_za158]|nr:hypothetical protein C0992_005913 [Termitomyces sp. T32_za158]
MAAANEASNSRTTRRPAHPPPAPAAPSPVRQEHPGPDPYQQPFCFSSTPSKCLPPFEPSPFDFAPPDLRTSASNSPPANLAAYTAPQQLQQPPQLDYDNGSSSESRPQSRRHLSVMELCNIYLVNPRHPAPLSSRRTSPSSDGCGDKGRSAIDSPHAHRLSSPSSRLTPHDCPFSVSSTTANSPPNAPGYPASQPPLSQRQFSTSSPAPTSACSSVSSSLSPRSAGGHGHLAHQQAQAYHALQSAAYPQHGHAHGHEHGHGQGGYQHEHGNEYAQGYNA